jgi:hypothetical protein
VLWLGGGRRGSQGTRRTDLACWEEVISRSALAPRSSASGSNCGGGACSVRFHQAQAHVNQFIQAIEGVGLLR